MRVEVHFEVKYDKWQHCPPNHQNDVVVIRASFTADASKTLEANCIEEGERVFAAAPRGGSGYNHRLEITAFEIDGVRSELASRALVAVKIKQAA
jgi:hypothetical protein